MSEERSASPVLSVGHAPAEEHHALPAHEALLLLATDRQAGLTDLEVERRLRLHGANGLPSSTSAGPVRRLLRQLHHPLIYVLLVAGALAAVLGETVDASVIFGVVVLNAAVGYVQESKAEAALDALVAMVSTSAKVTRGGRRLQVPSTQLVPGDLVHVEAGDKVPADLRLLHEDEVEADESALTGESVPAVKDEVVLPRGTPVADRCNMLYSGTFVTSGAGTGVVSATGAGTELGEVHRLVGSVQTLETPLTAALGAFSKVLTVVILALAAVAFTVGMARGEDTADMLTAAVALAVGAIPEGLPAAVSVTLAIGVARMARRRAVIRRLPAVETLGSTTVVCTDKTGTLTENRMTVVQVWTGDGGLELPADGGEVVVEPDGARWWTLAAGAACNDADRRRQDGRWVTSGDPTETALLVSAARAGVDVSGWTRSGTLAFSSERQWMATRHVMPGGQQVVCVKGALERVLSLCGSRLDADGSGAPLQPEAVREAAEQLAAQGLRLLAVAVCTESVPALGDDALRGRLVLAGLQAMHDPPRAAAAGAVRACRDAGIEVKMITGDHPATATAIGAELGLLGEGRSGVLTGTELDALPAEQLPDAVEATTVFARVSPAQKLMLVQALQERGHVVAMTGDGVNDAPALRQAQIGVAMGVAGTEVAKEAADMVLTDDDFATIAAAVEEGRGVFDNLTKFLTWTLPTNLAEGLVVLIAVLVGTTLPILPGQILWINMTTAVLLGLTLAFEAKEPGVMRRLPREPGAPLLSRTLLTAVVVVSAILVAATWSAFSWERALGAPLEEARTSAVNALVTIQVLYLFGCRSLSRRPRGVRLPVNRWLLVGVALQVAAQALLTYAPFMQQLFRTAPLDVQAWLRIAAVALVAAAALGVERHRRLLRVPAQDLRL